ncbi:DUF4168 domain-containing protein [Telmatospirillum sp. J64-1]|uniref:DUF4168 domain-containing protein n=1 Tax=Telmatospirillum sp. J64-1 TaxID=2502183 RepID=UPI00115EB519|nr:DUF4168 domain-containing protein [Telmatospirillum sp. J64-1]
MFPTIRNMIGAAAIAAVLSPLPALAQEATPEAAPAPGPEEQIQPQAQYDDATLEQFAAAAQEVYEVIEQYEPQLEGAETPEQAEQVRNEANQQLTQVIEDRGLTVDQYNNILVDALHNPELHQRIVELSQAPAAEGSEQSTVPGAQ